MPVSQAVDAVHIAVRDHRILREPTAWSPTPGQRDSLIPLVRLNGEVDPDRHTSMGRELAIAVVAEWPRLPRTQQLPGIGRLVVSTLDRAVADHSDDFVAHRMKAQALSFTRRYKSALEIADSLLKSAPSHELLLDDYCSYAIDLKHSQPALEAARRAVAVNPWSAAGHERLAFRFMQSQDWNSACHEARGTSPQPVPQIRAMFLVQCLMHDKNETWADNEFATLVKLHADQRESLEGWLAEQRRR